MRLLKVITAAILLAAMLGFTAYDRDNIMYQAAATVRMAEDQSGATGSATVIREGVAITAAHVPVDGTTVDGLEIAEVLYTDLNTDLVILSVPGLKCPCAILAHTAPFFLEEFMVVGYPAGLGVRVVTEGRFQGALPNDTYLLTAQATGGNSGGGAFNEEGALTGILLAIGTHRIEGLMFPLRAETNYLSQAASLDQIKEALLCADGIGLCNETP